MSPDSAQTSNVDTSEFLTSGDTDIVENIEGWKPKLLGDVFSLKNGFAFKSEFFSDFGPIVLTPGNFSLDGGLYFDERNTKRYRGPFDVSKMFAQGDLLIVMTDLTPDCNLLGKPAIVESKEVILHNQRIGKVILRDRSTVKRFLFYLLLSRRYLDRIKEMATGSTVRHTSNKSIYGVSVALPLPHEQAAIATALSDVDGLIDALDKVAAKKRAIKVATMQQLLTGKTRLPGFSAPWITKNIGQVAPLQRGFDLPSYSVRPGPYPVVYSNGVLNSHVAYMVEGPGVVTGRSGTIGKVSYIEQNFWPHNTSLWVTSFKGNNPKFIYFLYSFVGFQRFGTGSGVPTLNRNDVHGFEVNIPNNPGEQRAISDILSDMDADIAGLERRRDKTQDIKQGMMQALLTGRIRIAKPEVSA
jgi:type I restriction enzyme S subunit